MIFTILFYLILFLIIIPPIAVAILLFYLSNKYKLSYNIYGYLKYRNIVFNFEDSKHKIEIFVGNFQVYFIWFRIRFFIRNINVNITLKNKKIPKEYLENNKRNKDDGVDESELSNLIF